MNSDLSRRDFVRHACCSAVGGIGVLSTLAQLRVIAAVAGDSSPAPAAAVPSDYKALVCVFLAGGNDAMNLLVPTDAASHAAYAQARSNVAVGRATLLPISTRRFNDGRSYGLHPAAARMRSLYDSGRLAVLANVGMLAQPTTLAQYRTGRALPPKLFSHNDQQLHWQSSVPDQPFRTGWGGRLADLVQAMNENNQISMSITLAGVNNFQRGHAVNQFAVSPSGVANLVTGWADSQNRSIFTPGVQDARIRAVHSLMELQQANLLSAAFAGMNANALKNANYLSNVFRSARTLRTVFPGTSFGSQLAMVAKLISLASEMGVKRQVFFTLMHGYDTHGGQAEAHGPLLGELSTSLKAFYDATVELGIENQVTTFTASDFGRTYVPNAGGTDHGWGNHQFIMGGAVQGGDIYGQMPSLIVNGPDDTGRGRWIPSTSVDEYNATLATWFGVSQANLPVVLPNIGRFARPNLGFMG